MDRPHPPKPDAPEPHAARPTAPSGALAEPVGAFTGGAGLSRICDVDRLPPFLISVVSDSDHWMYVSSSGGLTAGRVDPGGALFPYVTDDKLHACHPHTGPLTLVRASTPRGPVLWEPLRRELDDGVIRRNLYKSPLANQLLFEEVHEQLGLAFRCRWETSDAFGFVRTVSLENLGAAPIELELVDGLIDLMPAGVPLALQQGASCLVNAYTRAEVDPATGLGLIALQALIVDQAVPAESLRTTTVFCTGLSPRDILLSIGQLPAFRRGQPVRPEALVKGRRGAYLVKASLRLAPGEVRRWRFVADVDRDHLQVQALRARLLAAAPKSGSESGSESGPDAPARLDAEIEADVARGTVALLQNVGSADGLQRTADEAATIHHYANVLFNNMRGGVFANGHRLAWSDFADFLRERNRPLGERLAASLAERPGETTLRALLDWASASGDPDLIRLAHEYLPLFFSRRHGDPSRPWNAFAIRLRKPDGSRALDYQGNWRDIFQNWEALCASHPDFLESVIAVFVDASTADGFNPYRISRAGIDWEVPEEGDPWSNIGYWGDHQIVYLGRLLEASARHHPGRLEAMLGERWFCYADVPYRLKAAAEIARDPRHTILFDHEQERRIEARVARVGGDGKLLRDPAGGLVRVTLLEKLLVPVLAKLAGLVVDGGIWMNTQRPEWNDANNALVGDGLSVVTLCQLRRHLVFLDGLLARAAAGAPDGPNAKGAGLSPAVRAWAIRTHAVLDEHRGLLARPEIPDADRRALLDELQAAFESHRNRVYAGDLGEPGAVPLDEVGSLLRLARAFVDHSIRANRRPDGLYHAYNLLGLSDAPRAARVSPLYEMLEGQVAVIGSGLLSSAEVLEVLDALFASRLYREDQRSFLLYPDRALPGFLEKNRIPQTEVDASPLLQALLAADDRSLAARDAFGLVRFAGHLRTAADVREAASRLTEDPRFAALAAADGGAVVDCYSRVFDLKSFTGRSGTMYGYEGLGCIYWHMVSKLLVAVQEAHGDAARRRDDPALLRRLAGAYYRVRGGLGFNKTAQEFGAFPTDPYSHTPGHAGAQQPGMTGLVKEEFLTRMGELGLEVRGGRISFEPSLLRPGEFLPAPSVWEWVDGQGTTRQTPLAAGELGFTLCQTPIVYRRGDRRSVQVRRADGTTQLLEGGTLDAPTSAEILGRTGAVAEVLVTLAAADLLLEHP